MSKGPEWKKLDEWPMYFNPTRYRVRSDGLVELIGMTSPWERVAMLCEPRDFMVSEVSSTTVWSEWDELGPVWEIDKDGMGKFVKGGGE